jgi:type IV pilus assembly protein PilY1
MDKGTMFFGLLTGSNTKNLSGGVLRKNIYSITDETNENGILQTSENVQGNIIRALDQMKVVGYQYSSYSYEDTTSGGTCGWIGSRPIVEGECRSWGNPVGEMMYEALRYLAGKTAPTDAFTYTTQNDSTVDLPNPAWGMKKGSTTLYPKDIFPSCSKPFLMVISDVNVNYDSNQLPGVDSNFGSFTGDLPNLNVSTLVNTIGTNESLSGKDWFIGQRGDYTDFVCTSKTIANLSSIRGLCPQEPTLQGSYYSAAVAYYGKEKLSQEITGSEDVTTMAIALAPPIPDLSFKVGNNYVRVVPVGKSVSGCYITNCYQKCTISKAPLLSGSLYEGLQITNCTSGAFCPTNQIVNLYIEETQYDEDNNLTKAQFRINFEDVEQGADYDMDAIVRYTITTSSTTINVSVDSNPNKAADRIDAAGCIDQVFGFVISGTTEDGMHLVAVDEDINPNSGVTPAIIGEYKNNGRFTWDHTFAVSGSAPKILKDPLWYSAKWGGFSDSNNNQIPDLQSEWDKDSNGVPDNYFLVTNPLKLHEQLDKAFAAIMGKVGSAGAVATVTQQVMGQDIVVRGAFTSYASDPSAFDWNGHLESYWPFEGCRMFSTESGCTEVSGCLWNSAPGCVSVCSDNTSEASCTIHPGCLWSNGECTASAELYTDCSETATQTACQANSSCRWTTDSRCSGLLYSFQKETNWNRFCHEHHDHCWEAEEKMPSPNARNIFSMVNGVQESFDSSNICTEADWLGLSTDSDFTTTDCSQLIDWIRGNYWSKGRDRAEWILGDIVYSTPVVVQSPSLSSVPTAATGDCGDVCEAGCDCPSDCAKSCFYCYRECLQYRKKVIYVGANDGMLHAFVAGVWWSDPNATENDDKSHWIYDPDEPDSKCRDEVCTGKEEIGRELWAYIPSNLLSKVKELAKQSYGTPDGCPHRFMVDLSPQAWDVFIDPDGIGPQPRQWRTVLVGGERGGGDTYFALDVTDPDNPIVLWEFSAFRNLVQVTGSDTSFQATLPYAGKNIYDEVKGLPMSWSVPYVGKLKIPDDVGFLASDPINAWTPATPTVSPSTRYSNDLSGWFAVIGSGPRIFNTDDLPASLSSDQKLATLKSNLLMIDIEKGINIFQYLWPLLQKSVAKWPDKASSAGTTYYSPYAMSNPLVLDIRNENDKLESDGYLDHIYVGDLNGDLFSLKFNLDGDTALGLTHGMQVDVWKTKTIPAADSTSNAFRSQDRQPITVLPTVAFDENYNLRIYFGTGKFDNIDGNSSDKTETTKMSFYNLKESRERPDISQSNTLTKQSTLPTTFSAASNPGTSNPLGFKMDNFGISVFTHCDTATFSPGCNWVSNCCASNCTGCWSCVYDLLSTGERVIDSALVAGGLVFFTTFIPKTDPCAVGGSAYLYIFNYQCGALSIDPFANSGFALKTSETQVTQGGQYAALTSGAGYVAMLGSGMPSRPVLDSSGEYVFIQTSDGRIHRIKVELETPPMIPMGWKQE